MIYGNSFKSNTGRDAEEKILSMMQEEGYRLIARNYEVHNVGELDLVMEKDNDIYVVEVRSRFLREGFPEPCETVTKEKERRIRKTTQIFALKNGLTDRNFIFLIGAVTHNRNGLIQSAEISDFY